MDSGLERKRVDERSFGMGQFALSPDRRFAAQAAGMAEEELVVAGFGPGELGVESAKWGIERSGGEEPEALARPSLDEAAEKELIEKRRPPAASPTCQTGKLLHIPIGSRRGESAPAFAHSPVNELEVTKLLAREASEIADEHRLFGKSPGNRHGVGRRLELTVGVIDEERIEISRRHLDPARRCRAP